MTVFLALFRDAWLRARDRKTVTVLILVGLVFALFCSSLEFGRPVPSAALHLQLAEFSIDTRPKLESRGGRGGLFSFSKGGTLKRPLGVDSRDPAPEDDLPQGLANVAVADIVVPDLLDFDQLARQWRASSTRKTGAPSQRDVPAQRDASAQPDANDTPLDARERAEFLEGVLHDHGWETVIARSRGDDGAHFMVAAATDHLAELEGVWKMSILFRAYSFDMPRSTPAEWVVQTEVGIADTFVGLVGMLIFLAAFCGAVPDLLQKGSLDLVLARPVGRARVLLFTYAGAVLTVLLVSATIFAACALALGVRSGYFSLAFVGCSLTAAAVFGMLYPVAMLTGLLSRNATLSMLTSVGFWGLAKTLATIRIAASFLQEGESPWRRAVDGLYGVMPKTAEMGLLDLTVLGKMQLSPSAYARLLQRIPQEIAVPEWWFVAWSSALFVVGVLLLTIAIFRRRDV